MNHKILFAGVLVCITSCTPKPDSIASLGTLEVDRIELLAESAEPIVQVLVNEGDGVAPGDVLMRQDSTRTDILLRKVRADLAVAAARLAEAEAGPRAQDIAAARAGVAALDSEMKTAGIELDRERRLVSQNFVSRSNVDVLAGKYETARARYQQAQAGLQELLDGTRSETIDAARSSHEIALAQVEDAHLTLQRMAVIAPVAGKVESVLREAGERPIPGSPVIVLVRDQTPYARVHVPEPLRAQLGPGAPAQVMVDGQAAALPGKLRWIAHDASYTPFYALTQHDRSHLSYLAEIDIESDVARQLVAGVPVQVYFPSVK
jgi:HlyD family secretion protein